MTDETVLPIGPQHPALHEPLLLKVHVRGEDVLAVEAVTGYNHRGIEKLAENNTWLRTLYIITRVCGICNIAHSLAYVQAVEKIQGIDPPPRAKALRTLVFELERLHSHMLIAAIMAEIVGFESLFMLVMRDRETVMLMKEIATGARVIADYVWPGGVRRDIDAVKTEKLKTKLPKLRERLLWLKRIYEEDALLRRRLEDIGRISSHDAIRYGLMGPSLRASGVSFDVRKAYPYDWYNEVEFRIVTRNEGDSLARMLVRIDEALESINIIEQILERLPGGPINALKTPLRAVKPGEGIGRVEAPRGELVYHVISRGGRKPYRVKIRTPSFHNILNTLLAYQGVTLSDVPVILASFDPCISCMERLVVVDHLSKKIKSIGFREAALIKTRR